jgi:hypothetical protein
MNEKLIIDDELEAIKFLEAEGIVVTIEKDIFLPKYRVYDDAVYETIDYLITIWDHIVSYIFKVEHTSSYYTIE